MILNFVIWSPLISLTAIIFLYPLRFHLRGSQVSRFYAAALLFPALISSLYVLKLTAFEGVLISQIARLPVLPIYVGIQLSHSNALLVACTILSVAFLIFFLPEKKFVENTLLVAVYSALLCIIALTPDQFIKTLTFTIGNVAVIYTILNDEQEKRVINKVTNDFPLHLISDLFAFTALFYLIIHHKGLFVQGYEQPIPVMRMLPRVVYFIALAIRVVAITAVDTNSSFRSHSVIKLSIFRKVFVSTGSLLLLLDFSPVIFLNATTIKPFFITVSFAPLVWVLISLIYERHKTTFADYAVNILTSLSFIAICLEQYEIARALLCITIAFYPLVALLVVTLRKPAPSAEKLARQSSVWTTLFERIFLLIPVRIARIFSQFITDFLIPIYSGFFLFRLPQIVIGILQTPLRILHNGNVQRSLIFVAIMFISFLLWELQ